MRLFSKYSLFQYGILLTLIYFIALIIVYYCSELKLISSWSDLGDMFAGVFSPVAFLWLVLGFLQQQKELQNNTAALNLQAEQLQKSVEIAERQSSQTAMGIQAAYDAIEKPLKPTLVVNLNMLNYKAEFETCSLQLRLNVVAQHAFKVKIHTIPIITGIDNYSSKILRPGEYDINSTDIIIPRRVYGPTKVIISYESSTTKQYSEEFVFQKHEGGCYTLIE
ncbi:hypothetical protein [Citrobacter freundii]|uniref:hypothetical protein n=1 Tax=Citrobacter freundii TaxID=546 RepID=UPI0022909228|nr:hypothetical protein [Citrobacter freundii]MDT7355636.1 hypothetical protein [Citrobacter freundii]MEB0828264.1 hypothetical protein [Citrobacter freundii]MEB2698547.1 hypothetical protein [Citrobacter freundii]WOP95156.1 hypothetical protein R2X26_11145 [Citrobacter freundii]HCW3487135.1 hypothetical protein [Citrobacter freundii]